jgi:hypothetical protein
MCTRMIATGAGITGNADCPPAFRRSGNPVSLGLWCCAVSFAAAAPGLTRTYMLTAYMRRLHSMPHSPPYTHSLAPPAHMLRPRSPPPRARPSLTSALARSRPSRQHILTPRFSCLVRVSWVSCPVLGILSTNSLSEILRDDLGEFVAASRKKLNRNKHLGAFVGPHIF